MRSLLRPGNLFILCTYFLLSAVPFVPYLFPGQTVTEPLRILGMQIVSWIAIWVLFKRPAWFHIFLLPAFFALPIEIYLRAYYGQSISTHHLGILLETSPKEAFEFLGHAIWLLLLIVILVIAWWGLTWRAAWRTRDLDWNGKSRLAVFALLSLSLAAWLYGLQYGVRAIPDAASVAAASDASDDASDDAEESSDPAEVSASSAAPSVGASVNTSAALPPLPSWAKVPFEVEQFGNAWPFGLAVRGYDFWKERQYLVELSIKSSQFKFGAHQGSDAADTPEVFVMVIGESSRYDRWSLNGYRRATNPLLSNETNLVSLSNIITAVSATRLSVPVIVSRKPATQSLQAGFSEKSFIGAFKEAGFKTWWLSNQMSFGQFDTPISVFAKEADVVQFTNLGGFTDKSSYDQVLLAPLVRALADPAKKKLIVLHSLGNHWNYSQRHPREFDKWQPSLYGMDNPVYTDLKIKPQLNNSYDNSILYTDWFLEQVITALKRTEQLSALMYVADHGQTLYDGSCNLAFHGHNTQYEFHIPAFVWYSDRYQADYPDKIAQLQRHKKARLSTENVFHSLLDLADLHYSGERLDWSFMNAKLKRHKRYVDSYGWSDYDNATFKGDCREVIDKGHPLPQEK